jgi:general stress protein YciG
MSNATENPTAPQKPLRGFAAMTAEQRRQLGSKGGKTAHERGTANKFTSESATVAGKIPHERGTAHKWTSDEARAAGRKGGTAARRGRNSEG